VEDFDLEVVGWPELVLLAVASSLLPSSGAQQALAVSVAEVQVAGVEGLVASAVPFSWELVSIQACFRRNDAYHCQRFSKSM
jgi:hypothetical protein